MPDKCINCGSATSGQECDKCDYPLCDSCAEKAPVFTLRDGSKRGPLCRDCAELVRELIADEETDKCT